MQRQLHISTSQTSTTTCLLNTCRAGSCSLQDSVSFSLQYIPTTFAPCHSSARRRFAAFSVHPHHSSESPPHGQLPSPSSAVPHNRPATPPTPGQLPPSAHPLLPHINVPPPAILTARRPNHSATLPPAVPTCRPLRPPPPAVATAFRRHRLPSPPPAIATACRPHKPAVPTARPREHPHRGYPATVPPLPRCHPHGRPAALSQIPPLFDRCPAAVLPLSCRRPASILLHCCLTVPLPPCQRHPSVPQCAAAFGTQVHGLIHPHVESGCPHTHATTADMPLTQAAKSPCRQLHGGPQLQVRRLAISSLMIADRRRRLSSGAAKPQQWQQFAGLSAQAPGSF